MNKRKSHATHSDAIFQELEQLYENNDCNVRNENVKLFINGYFLWE